MNKFTKILAVTLLIICFTSTLFGCTSTNEVTDNNETTTVGDNETKETTTKETEPATEEPTTEEPTTEYVKKGKYVVFDEGTINFEKINNLTLQKGTKIYINDLANNNGEESDYYRGNIALSIIHSLYDEKDIELIKLFETKYFPDGVSSPKIPYADNYYIEYIYDEVISFHYIETIDGIVCFDLY